MKMIVVAVVAVILASMLLLVGCDGQGLNYLGIYKKVSEDEVSSVRKMIADGLFTASFSYKVTKNLETREFNIEHGNEEISASENSFFEGSVECANENIVKTYQHYVADSRVSFKDGGAIYWSDSEWELRADSDAAYLDLQKGTINGVTVGKYLLKSLGADPFGRKRYYANSIVMMMINDDSCGIYRSGQKYKLEMELANPVGISGTNTVAYISTKNGKLQSIKVIQTYEGEREYSGVMYYEKLRLESLLQFGDYSVDIPDNTDEYVPVRLW